MSDTVHVREIDISDYLPGEDEDCQLNYCVNKLVLLGKRCGLTDKQAIGLVDGFMDAVHVKLGIYWEVVETFEEGALKPAEGRALIEKLGQEIATGNHELFERHLTQLIDNFCINQLGTDPHVTISDEMQMPMEHHDVWRDAWEAAENRGICPDQAFVDSLTLPKKFPYEIGDISGIGMVPVWYHFPIDEKTPEERAAIKAAFEQGFSIQMTMTDEHGNTTTEEIKIGGDEESD